MNTCLMRCALVALSFDEMWGGGGEQQYLKVEVEESGGLD